MSINNYLCPTGCSSDIPDLEFDDCAPEVHFGEITYIAVTKSGHPLVNVEDPNEWATRLASLGDDRIQLVRVIGDMPLPESTEVVISGSRKVQSLNKDFTINIEVDETNDTNYEFMRFTNCNPTLLAWVITSDHIRGGNDGISSQIILGEQIEKDSKSVQKFIGKMTWTNRNYTARTLNVLP